MSKLEISRLVLGAALPMRVGGCGLSLAAEPEIAIDLDARGAVVSLLRLTLFAADGSIREHRDQRVMLGAAADVTDVARLEAFLRGWLKVLPAFLSHAEEVGLTPLDLVFPEMLASAKLSTERDFEVAHGQR